VLKQRIIPAIFIIKYVAFLRPYSSFFDFSRPGYYTQTGIDLHGVGHCQGPGSALKQTSRKYSPRPYYATVYTVYQLRGDRRFGVRGRRQQHSSVSRQRMRVHSPHPASSEASAQSGKRSQRIEDEMHVRVVTHWNSVPFLHWRIAAHATQLTALI